MAIQGGSVRWVIEADASNFENSLDQASSAVKSLDEQIEKVDSSAKGKIFNSLSSGLGDTTSLIKSLGNSLKSVAWGTFEAGATTATTALIGLTRKGIQATDFLESARIGMAGLSGSFVEGNKAMTEAAKFWQNNPFQRIDVTQATQQLVQFGRKTNQIADDLEILGNVSLSTGMNIGDLARYYARVSASGRAMTMDLEMMSDRGVPIYRELEKALNTTTAGVREMASKGKIDFETFRKAMEGAVNAEAMAEYENTLARQTDRLKGSIQILAGELAGYKIANNELVISAEGLEKAWTRLLKALATGLRGDKMKAAMAKIGQAIARVIDKITELVPLVMDKLGTVLNFIGDNAELIIPVLGGFLAVVGKLGLRIPVVSDVLQRFGGVFGNLKSTLLAFGKTHPIISAFIALFGAGFVNAMKTSEDFRNTIKDLATSLGQLAKNLVEAVKPIIDVLVYSFKELASSDIVKSILQVVASAVAWLAKALASIPKEVLSNLISFFLTLKLLKVGPIYAVIAAVTVLLGSFQHIWDFLKDLPKTLITIGRNIVVGLANGLINGAKIVWNAAKSIASGIVTTFKNVLGIHSPSRAMYYIGQYITLGLANGIEDSKSVVQKAMDDLASDILSLSQKVISNQVQFNLLDPNQEYKAWQKVSRLFTEGSAQYETALEKMEEARKQVNIRIIQLQENYNDRLDESIEKIRTMYGTFSKVDLTGGMSADEIIENMDQQVAKLSEWAADQEIIADLELDPGFIEELQQMGVDAVDELSAIANMSTSQLAEINRLWQKKQEIANKAAVRQMANLKEDTLNEVAKLRDGIQGETVEVTEAGGRLVASYSDGIVGALPTLESAFDKFDDYLAKAAKSINSNNEVAEAAEEFAADTDGTIAETGKAVEESLTETVNKLQNGLKSVLPGVIAAFAAYKFGPKILQALGLGKNGGIASKLASALKNIFGGKETVKAAGEAVKQGNTLAKQTNSIATATQEVNKGMTKAQSFLKTIREGALTVVAIAGAIISVALAIRGTYELLKEVDFGKFQLQVVMLAEAIAAMGTLAWAVGKVNIEPKSLLTIAGIAADLAVVATAIWAMDKLIPDNFGNLQLKIVAVVESIVALGYLSAIAGGLWEQIAKGLLVIAGMAGDLILISQAIWTMDQCIPGNIGTLQPKMLAIVETIAGLGILSGIVGIAWFAVAAGLACIAGMAADLFLITEAIGNMNRVIPDDMGKVYEKIGLVSKTILSFEGLSVIGGVVAVLSGLAWLTMLSICDEITRLAIALGRMNQEIPDDVSKVEPKLDLIIRAIGKIARADLGNLFGLIAGSIKSEQIKQIADDFVEIARLMNTLQDIPLEEQAIFKALDNVAKVVEYIKEKSEFSWGVIKELIGTEAYRGLAENSSKVLGSYVRIAEDIGKLEQNVGKSFDLGKVTRNVNNIAKVVDLLTNQEGNGLAGLLQRAVGQGSFSVAAADNASQVIEAYVRIADSAMKLHGVPQETEAILDSMGRIVNKLIRIPAMSDAIKTGVVNTVNAASDALNAMVRMRGEAARLQGLSPDTEAKIDSTNRILAKLIFIPGFSDAQKTSVVNTLNAGSDALNAMIRLRGEAAQLQGLPSDTEGKIDSTNRILAKLISIPRFEDKDKVQVINTVNAAVDSADRLLTLSSILGRLTAADNNVLNSLLDAIRNIANLARQNLDAKLGDFIVIGQNICNAVARGINNQLGMVAQVGANIQGTLWNAIEPRISHEYYQGEAMARSFRNGLIAGTGNIAQIGANWQGALWNAIEPRMSDEYWQGYTMARRLIDGFVRGSNDYPSTFNAGAWAVAGFQNGANAQAYDGSRTWWLGYSIARNLLDGIAAGGRQGSPWKTTYQSGAWAVEGLIEGIEATEGEVIDEATQLARAVADALSVEDITVTPSVGLGNLGTGVVASTMDLEEGYGRGVVIQQTNNNYTEYSIEQVNRDLAWELAKV